MEAKKENKKPPEYHNPFLNNSKGLDGAIEICTAMVHHCDAEIVREEGDSEERQQLHER